MSSTKPTAPCSTQSAVCKAADEIVLQAVEAECDAFLVFGHVPALRPLRPLHEHRFEIDPRLRQG